MTEIEKTFDPHDEVYYGSKEEKKRIQTQPEITIHPYDYDICACCLTCTNKNICSLGDHGDFGVCKVYEDDGSSGK